MNTVCLWLNNETNAHHNRSKRLVLSDFLLLSIPYIMNIETLFFALQCLGDRGIVVVNLKFQETPPFVLNRMIVKTYCVHQSRRWHDQEKTRVRSFMFHGRYIKWHCPAESTCLQEFINLPTETQWNVLLYFDNVNIFPAWFLKENVRVIPPGVNTYQIVTRLVCMFYSTIIWEFFPPQMLELCLISKPS